MWQFTRDLFNPQPPPKVLTTDQVRHDDSVEARGVDVSAQRELQTTRWLARTRIKTMSLHEDVLQLKLRMYRRLHLHTTIVKQKVTKWNKIKYRFRSTEMHTI